MTSANPSERTHSRAISRELGARFIERLDLGDALVQAVPAGATVLHTGESLTRVPFVVSGRLDSVLHLQGADGGYIIPVSFAAGEVVFLSQLFSHQPSFVDLVAGEPSSLRWLPMQEVERLLLAEPSLMVLLVQFLVHRLREVQARERGWLERGVHERVCATLTRLAHQAPKASDGTACIMATHEELSARSGVSRPKLSQELKRLEQAGRVRLERGSVRVIDLGSLFDPMD